MAYKGSTLRFFNLSFTSNTRNFSAPKSSPRGQILETVPSIDALSVVVNTWQTFLKAYQANCRPQHEAKIFPSQMFSALIQIYRQTDMEIWNTTPNGMAGTTCFMPSKDNERSECGKPRVMEARSCLRQGHVFKAERVILSRVQC